MKHHLRRIHLERLFRRFDHNPTEELGLSVLDRFKHDTSDWCSERLMDIFASQRYSYRLRANAALLIMQRERFFETIAAKEKCRILSWVISTVGESPYMVEYERNALNAFVNLLMYVDEKIARTLLNSMVLNNSADGIRVPPENRIAIAELLVEMDDDRIDDTLANVALIEISGQRSVLIPIIKLLWKRDRTKTKDILLSALERSNRTANRAAILLSEFDIREAVPDLKLRLSGEPIHDTPILMALEKLGDPTASVELQSRRSNGISVKSYAS